MSSIDKYTRDIKNVNAHVRTTIERKRSEIMLRLSELNEAVQEPPSSYYRNTNRNDQTPKLKLSGAQRRKLGKEKALAIGAPIRPRRRRRPRDLESSRVKTRPSPRRTSITRERTIIDERKNSNSTNPAAGSSSRLRINRSSRSPNNRNMYPTFEKYDPAFPTPNESTRNRESLPYNSASGNRSRSPYHRSRPDFKDTIRSPEFRSSDRLISSPDRRDGNLSSVRYGRHLSPVRHGRNHSPVRHGRHLSPVRHGRNLSPVRHGRNLSPVRRERNLSPGRDHRSRSPGRHRRSPDRRITNRSIRSRSANRRDRNRSPGNHPSELLNSNSRKIDSLLYNTSTSTRVDDFGANQHAYTDMAYNFNIPTNYTNQFVNRSHDIDNGRDSRWHDSALHSYSQSNYYRPDGDIRILDQIGHSQHITSNNSDRLRSRDSDHPLRPHTNTRTNEEEVNTSHRQSDPSNINTDLIRLSIVPVDYPKETLTKSQTDDIELALISYIKPGKAGTGPQFSYISFSQRTLIAGCKNMETKLWLEDVVPKLQMRNVGPLKVLTTEELNRSEKMAKVTMFVPHPIAKKPVSTLLTLIKTQNVGLETESWRVLGSNDKPSGLTIALRIDNKSLATLEKLDLKACLGLTQAKFNIIKRERGN